MERTRPEVALPEWKVVRLASITWAAIIAVGLMLLSVFKLLPDAPDAWTLDWRTSLLSTRASSQHPQVAVVLVDEDSLARYFSRSPVDRALIAQIIKAIDEAEPLAIGVDFIFDRKAEPDKTERLQAALREAKSPIFMGAIDKRAALVKEASFKYQDDFIAGTNRPSGHIFFARQDGRLTIGDEVVRSMVLSPDHSAAARSLTELLADVDGRKRRPTSPLIAWLLPPWDASIDTFTTLRIPEHEPADALRSPASVLPLSWRPALKGKIVLVGGDFVDRDQHLTPLSVMSNQRTPGVLIHAQIVAQLRDGRSIWPMPLLMETLVVFTLGLIGFLAGRRWQLGRFGQIVYIVTLGLLVLAGAACFYWFSLVLPSTPLLLAFLGGISGGYNCDWVLERLGLLETGEDRSDAASMA